MSIEVVNLSFRYGNNAPRDALSEVSLNLRTGDLHFLIGPNGSGKTTLIRCITGLLTPTRGMITIQGENLLNLNNRERARRIGYVPQSEAPTFSFTARQVVVMGRASFHNLFGVPSPDDYHHADQAMNQVGIIHLADRECTSISGGEWQLVLIARALAQQPSVLLMDEPTSHLDLSNQMRILSTIRDLIHQGYTVIFVSHNPDQAFLIRSQVSVMKEGRIIQTGTAEEVITSSRMEETYGVKVMILLQNGNVIRGVCVPVLPE
jgi:iron complex transport system ATP-binding protein